MMNDSIQADIINLSEEHSSPQQGENSRKKTLCKFVLISNERQVHLVFGLMKHYPYHANLVERFCQDRDIPSLWVRKPDLHEILEKDYQVKGGGMMEINPTSRVLKVFGYSTAYGQFEYDSLSHVLKRHPYFEQYSINVKQ